MKEKDSRSVAASPESNPEWLQGDPEGPDPRAPLHPKASVLPFLEQGWRDFERLCRRLAERDGTVEVAQAYGIPGQAQYGIDILVRLTDGTFEVWQTKRYEVFTAADVREAVSLFLRHKWAAQARKFRLAVACGLDATGVVDAIEAARDQLRAQSIGFDALDGIRLTERLRTEPDIVDDFFGRSWVLAVCPAEAAEVLAMRLSRPSRLGLRRGLNECYSSWAVTVDPGLPIAGLDRHGLALPAVSIAQRYVKPDVLRMLEVERTDRVAHSGAAEAQTPTQSANPAQAGGDAGEERVTEPEVREQRISVDQFLASTDRALIAAEAGVGKSTLLRMLALDILSDTPQFACVRGRYAGYVPVWVSFPLWTRMASGRAVPPALEEVVAEFLRAQSRPELADDMRKALAQSRIVLLVDGLDEAVDPTAAQTVAALLAAFVESRRCPAFVTSRPHGLRAARGFPGTWLRVELAPLSDRQRYALCELWFRVLERLENTAIEDEARLERRTQQRTTAFCADLQRHPAIGRLSQTPLFLLSLMELYRHGRQLPRSRFAAIEKIVAQLVQYQPQRRDTDSLLTVALPTNSRLRDRLLCDFAFALQSGELSGSVTDAAAEEAAVTRAIGVILERQGGENREAAETLARATFEFGQERAGLLVKKASRTIGFLHLALQEFLAGRHVLQYSPAERIAFVRDHAALPRWREPILYLLHLLSNEEEVGQLIRAVEQAPVWSIPAAQHRDALLTDAVFADLAHDVTIVREIATRLLSESELTAWGARQRHLLTSVVDGLGSEAVAQLCRAKIGEWLPNRFGAERAKALRTMPQWPSALRSQCCNVLMRSLMADEEKTRTAAAEVLATWAGGAHDAKDRLIAFLKVAPSAAAAATTLYALGQGWTGDDDVGELAAVARQSCHPEVALQGIRICAKREQTNTADFDRFFNIIYRDRISLGSFNYKGNRDLLEHFATVQRDRFIGRLHTAVAGLHRGFSALEFRPLLAALLTCDPTDAWVQRRLLELLRLPRTQGFRALFKTRDFPVERVIWTPELVERLESQPWAFDGADLYDLSKVEVLRHDRRRTQLLSELQLDTVFRSYAARALIEHWGPGDPEVIAVLVAFLDASPEEVASVADTLPVVAPDAAVCRAALLRAIRSGAGWMYRIVEGLRRLGISQDDEEMFEAVRARAGQEDLIQAFPRRPEVRVLALEALTRCYGPIAAVANSYCDDSEMLCRVLRVLAPQPRSARAMLVAELGRIAPGSSFALAELDATRQELDAGVCVEATLGWVESLVKRGALEDQHVEWLVSELTRVGLEQDKRRAAAALGLVIAGHLERFATAVDESGRPVTVRMTQLFTREDGGRYVGYLLDQWDALVLGLGGEVQVLQRLQISPERLLAEIDRDHPNGPRVCELMQQLSCGSSASRYETAGAEALSVSERESLRESIRAVINEVAPQFERILTAGEILVDHFADDSALREQVTAALLRTTKADADLAELLLRHPSGLLKRTLKKKTRYLRLNPANLLKLVAALSSPPGVVESLESVLGRNLNRLDERGFKFCVPDVLKRIERDAALRECMGSALTSKAVPSVKVSFVALLARAAGVDERLRRFAVGELQRTASEGMPQVGFDMVSQTYRLVRQVLLEVVG